MISRELVVKGIGKASSAPDLIVITMKIESLGQDYEKSLFSGNEKLDTLKASIISAGHERNALKTTNFSVRTEYERYQVGNNYKQRFIGYLCQHDLKLEFALDMDILGKTLGAIANSKVNPTFDISFTIKDPSAISAQLLENAVENAKWKATVLAKASDVKLGNIQRIDYNWSDIHFYSRTRANFCEDAYDGIVPASPMDIEPEDINVSDTVTVIWSIE